MSRRASLLTALVVTLLVATVATRTGDETPTMPAVGAEPGVQMPAVPPADTLASTWYCAAGTTGDDSMADHTVVVFNPSEEPVTGVVRVHSGAVTDPTRDDGGDDGSAGGDGSGEDGGEGSAGGDGDDRDARAGVAGSRDGDGEPGVGAPWAPAGEGTRPPVEEPIELTAHGRVAVRLADISDAHLAAAVVEADGAVVVEHQVEGPRGRDVGPCASAASSEWHVAWGATTRDAREVLVLFNPFPTPATVDLTFSTDEGTRTPVRHQGMPVPPGGVVGVDVGDDVAHSAPVAASIRTRSGSIVVERIQTFDGSGDSGATGLSVALAARHPLEAWTFATGRLGAGRGERIVVYNPTDQRAEVDVGVLPTTDDRPPPPFGLTVQPGGWEVVDYADDRVPRSAGHATVVRSRNGVPVVAERVATFPTDDGGDLAAGTGAAFADTRWLFATRGTDDDAVSFLVAYNPDPERTAHASVTGYVDGDAVAPDELQDVEVAPGGRTQLRFEDLLDTSDLAAVIRSDLPLVVARTLWTPDNGGLAVGPGVLGDRSPVRAADLPDPLPS